MMILQKMAFFHVWGRSFFMLWPFCSRDHDPLTRHNSLKSQCPSSNKSRDEKNILHFFRNYAFFLQFFAVFLLLPCRCLSGALVQGKDKKLWRLNTKTDFFLDVLLPNKIIKGLVRKKRKISCFFRGFIIIVFGVLWLIFRREVFLALLERMVSEVMILGWSRDVITRKKIIIQFTFFSNA